MADEAPKLVTVHSEGGYFNITPGKDQFGRQDDREAIKKAKASNTMGTPYKSPEEAARGMQTASLTPAPAVAPDPVIKPLPVKIKPLNDDGTPVGSGPLESYVDAKANTLVAAARAEGIDLRITSRKRTKEEQAAIYAEGRDATGKLVDPSKRLTNAVPGTSNHETGRAFDVAIFTNGKPDFKHSSWGRVGQLGLEIGLSWGGNWKQKDIPHFEMDAPKETGAKTAEAGPDPIANVRRYDPLINKYADKYGVPRDLARGMMLQESGGNPKAESSQNARGLLQLIPETWTRMGGGDINDPETNIDHGLKYMGQHLAEFKTPEAALAAYHQGEGTTRQTGGKAAGPNTRHFVQAVMANTARFGLTASSQADQAPTSVKTPGQATQDNLEVRDPRLPIIYQALRLKGKKADDFTNRLKDPSFRSQMYDASMQYAESLDPKLRMVAGEAAYLKVLGERPSPDGTPGPMKPKPVATATNTPLERTWLPEASMSGLKDAVVQTTVGAATDVAKGVVGVAEDVGGWLQRADKKFKDFTGMDLTSKDITGTIIRPPGEKRVSQSIAEWADETIGKPKSTTTAVTRAAAGFLVPFLKAQKGLRAVGMGKIASGTIASAAVTATQTPEFSINDPLVSVAVADFARELWVDNPAEGKGVIARYIDGTLPEDELLKRLAQRGFRTAEDIAFGGIADGVIGGFRMIKAAWRAEKLAKLDAVKAPPMPDSPSSPGDLGGPSGPRGPESPPDVPGPLEGRQKLRDAEDRDRISDLSRDLEIRKTVRESEELVGELKILRDADVEYLKRPDAPNTAFGVEHQMAQADELNRAATESNALATELEKLRPSHPLDPTTPRHPVTDEVLDSTPKPLKPSEVIQDRVLTELTKSPNPARVLRNNHNRYMQELMKSGMKPDEARGYLKSLEDVTNSMPETINLDPPARIKELEDIIDDTRIGQENIDIPSAPKATDIANEGLFPGVASLPIEQVANIASDLVDSGGGALGTFMSKLKDAGLDTLSTKAIIAAVLKGTAVGLIANEVIDPTSSEAAAEGEPEKSEKVFGLVMAAILGVGVIKALKIGKQLKNTISEGGEESITAGLRMKASLPTDHAVKPGIPTSRITALKKLSPEELADPMALFEHTRPEFENIADIQDYRAHLAASNDLFKGQPDAARQKWLNTPLNSAQELAEAIGADPKELQALIDRTNTPLLYSDDMKSILYNSLKAKGQLLNLVTAWHGMPAGADMPDLADKIFRLHGVYGQLASGLEMTRSDFGRGLNVPKQAADGRLLTMAFEGVDAGDLIKNPEKLEQYMAQLLKLLEEPGGAAAVMARKMAKPATLGGAISQAFMHSLLASTQTVANVAWSSLYRLALNPMIRFAGSATQHLTGSYKAGESPALEEAFSMIASMARNFTEGVQVAKKTLITGDTVFLERGSSLGAMHGQSQFTREAFGPIPKAMDSIGGLVGMPNAGNMFNYIGSFMEVLGTRGLISLDEGLQFLVERMELDAHAIRASKNPAHNFKNMDEIQTFMRDFKANPSKEVLAEIAYQKTAASYMNNMFDHRGGFQAFREMTGHIENGIKAWPIVRVFAPFLKTAANVLQMTGEMTPGISFLNSELRNPNPWIRGEAQGRMMVGIAASTAFAAMGAAGIIRGTLTNNPAYRAELEAAGVPENSIDWGGRTWKINPREPIGFLATFFGQMGAAANGESVADDEMGMAAQGYEMIMNLLKDQTVAGAIAELMADISPEALDRKLEKLGAIGAVIDTIDDLILKPMLPFKQFQDVTLVTDGTRRAFDTYWEKLKARTPWLSDMLPPETSIFREPRWAGSGLSADSVNNALKIVTGVSQDKIKQNPLSTKLIAKQIHIGDPRPVMEYGGVSIPMTKAEQQELRWMIGHPPGAPMSLYDAVMQLTNHPQWEELSSGSGGQAETVVKDLVQQYTTYSRRYMLARSESMQQRLKDVRIQKGLDQTPEGQ